MRVLRLLSDGRKVEFVLVEGFKSSFDRVSLALLFGELWTEVRRGVQFDGCDGVLPV